MLRLSAARLDGREAEPSLAAEAEVAVSLPAAAPNADKETLVGKVLGFILGEAVAPVSPTRVKDDGDDRGPAIIGVVPVLPDLEKKRLTIALNCN